METYKDELSTFLLLDHIKPISEQFDVLANDDPNNLLEQFHKLGFFAQICFSQIKSNQEEQIQFPKHFNHFLFDHFLISLLDILTKNINQQNILIGFKIISLISQNKKFYQHFVLLDIINLIILNFSLLDQNQINLLNVFNLLKIIKFNYKQESARKIIQEKMPVEFLLKFFSKFIDANPSRLLQWLKFLNRICSFQHSNQDGRLIFENLSNVRSKIKITYHFNYLCNIVINMIKFKTLPIDLFSTYNYPLFFRDLLLKKNNNSIIEYILYVIGLCTLNNIISGFYDVNFFLRIFSEHNDDKIRINVIWNLSVGLNKEICHFLIENNFFNYIVNIYPKCSACLKHEIAMFINDMMCKSFDEPEIFISIEIIEILVDTMTIFNEDTYEVSDTLYKIIESSIPRGKDNNTELVKNYLRDSNFIEIIENMRNSINQLENKLAFKYINWLKNE